MASSYAYEGKPNFFPPGVMPGTVRRGKKTVERMTDGIEPRGNNRWTTEYNHSNGKDYSKVTVWVEKIKEYSAQSRVPITTRVNVHSSVTGDWRFTVAFNNSPPNFRLVGFINGFGNDGPRVRRSDMFELYKVLPATAKIELRVAQNMIAIEYGRPTTRGGGLFIDFVELMIENLDDPDDALSARALRSVKNVAGAALQGGQYLSPSRAWSRMRIPKTHSKKKNFNTAGLKYMKPGMKGAIRAMYDVYMEDRI